MDQWCFNHLSLNMSLLNHWPWLVRMRIHCGTRLGVPYRTRLRVPYWTRLRVSYRILLGLKISLIIWNLVSLLKDWNWLFLVWIYGVTGFWNFGVWRIIWGGGLFTATTNLSPPFKLRQILLLNSNRFKALICLQTPWWFLITRVPFLYSQCS